MTTNKMKLQKKISMIIMKNVEFGAKNKTIWVSKITPQILTTIYSEIEKNMPEEKKYFYTDDGFDADVPYATFLERSENEFNQAIQQSKQAIKEVLNG